MVDAAPVEYFWKDERKLRHAATLTLLVKLGWGAYALYSLWRTWSRFDGGGLTWPVLSTLTLGVATYFVLTYRKRAVEYCLAVGPEGLQVDELRLSWAQISSFDMVPRGEGGNSVVNVLDGKEGKRGVSLPFAAMTQAEETAFRRAVLQYMPNAELPWQEQLRRRNGAT